MAKPNMTGYNEWIGEGEKNKKWNKDVGEMKFLWGATGQQRVFLDSAFGATYHRGKNYDTHHVCVNARATHPKPNKPQS